MLSMGLQYALTYVTQIQSHKYYFRCQLYLLLHLLLLSLFYSYSIYIYDKLNCTGESVSLARQHSKRWYLPAEQQLCGPRIHRRPPQQATLGSKICWPANLTMSDSSATCRIGPWSLAVAWTKEAASADCGRKETALTPLSSYLVIHSGS